MADYKLDVQPLDKAENACAWFARAIRHEGGSHAGVKEGSVWLEWMGQRVGFASREPVLMIAFARCASDANVREAFKRGVAEIEAAIEEYQREHPPEADNGTNGHAPTPGEYVAGA